MDLGIKRTGAVNLTTGVEQKADCGELCLDIRTVAGNDTFRD